MGDLFLKYLKNFNSPGDIVDEKFRSFTERLTAYLDFIKKEDRDEVPESIEVGRRLRDLGAPMESYKIMKADANYYKNRGNIEKFWHQMYYAGAFANLGYPTRSIEVEAIISCKELRREKKFSTFLPLFLNNYAGILHIYREDYRAANEVYREAILAIEDVNPRDFESKVGREYLWAHKLICNNYIDSLLVTERTEKDDEKLERIMDIAEKRLGETESEYARTLTLLNRAEMRARSGRIEAADKVLTEVFQKASERGLVEPSYYRIKAIILANKGDKEGSVGFLIRALEEAGYYGNTLAETLTMRDSLSIYNVLVNKEGVRDRYRFFKEKGLFDYLMKVLRIKDWYLGSEHSENVRKTALGIAKALSLKNGPIELIRTSAFLHDIGKCAIPWYSLNKISPLDDLDWEILWAHPTEGGRILRKLGLQEEAGIVENHHERRDGSGYPRGIKDISLETEIVAVSDAYNAAITPNRKYRVPKLPEEVLYEIKKGAKGAFSPKIIEGLKKYIQGESY